MTGGIISLTGDRFGGSGGGSSPANYFLRNGNPTGGSQIGTITRKPQYFNSHTFTDFQPYDFVINAGGTVIIVGKDLISGNTMLKALKIQHLDDLEPLSTLDLEEDLNLDNDYTRLLVNDGYAYILDKTGKIVKVDVSDLGDMKKFPTFTNAAMTNLSDMSFYGSFLIVSTIRTAAQDPVLFVVDVENNMSLINTIRPEDPADLDTVIKLHVQGRFTVCLSNKSGGTKSVTIIDNANIRFSQYVDVISRTPFTMTNNVARLLYVHNETAYVVGVGAMRALGIANKTTPTVFNEFITGGSISYGLAVLGRYMLISTWNFDTLGTYDINDLNTPVLIEGFTESGPYLNAVTKIQSYGNYVFSISQATAITQCFAVWDVNGFTFPSIEAGSALIRGKAYFNDQVRIGEELIVEKNIIAHVARVNYIYGHNIFKSVVPVRRLEDFPPRYWIDKVGDTNLNVYAILNIDTTGLTAGMNVNGPGIPSNTYVETVESGLNIVTLNQAATQTASSVPFKFDEHIDLEDAPGIEFWIDTPVFSTRCPIQIARTGSSGLSTAGESTYVYTGAGAAIRGFLDPNRYFALVGKFITSQFYPPDIAQLFDLSADPASKSTILIENLVTTRVPPLYNYVNVGSMNGLNIAGNTAQIAGWGVGWSMNNARKIKLDGLSFSDGGNAVGADALTLTGEIEDSANIANCDIQPTGENEKFFNIDPVTASHAASELSLVTLSSNSLKGNLDQFFRGSVNEKTLGMKVTGCSVPDSTVLAESFLIVNSSSNVLHAQDEWQVINGGSNWTHANLERISGQTIGLIEYLSAAPSSLKLSCSVRVVGGAQAKQFRVSFIKFLAGAHSVTFNPGNIVTQDTARLSNGDIISFFETISSVPAEIFEGTLYYVVNLSGNNFQLSYTPGGAPITFTSGGETPDYKDTKLLGLPEQQEVPPSANFGTFKPPAITEMEKNEKIYIALSQLSGFPFQTVTVASAYYQASL